MLDLVKYVLTSQDFFLLVLFTVLYGHKFGQRVEDVILVGWSTMRIQPYHTLDIIIEGGRLNSNKTSNKFGKQVGT